MTVTSVQPAVSTRRLLVLLVAIAVLLAGVVTAAYALTGPATKPDARVPQSAAMENKLGVRFSRLAVVGDGGLVQVNFVVLDADKATTFELGLSKPPMIVSENRAGGTKRISVMKQGHHIVAGQTYYLVYENTRGAVVGGGKATIVAGDVSLKHIPVLG